MFIMLIFVIYFPGRWNRSYEYIRRRIICRWKFYNETWCAWFVIIGKYCIKIITWHKNFDTDDNFLICLKGWNTGLLTCGASLQERRVFVTLLTRVLSGNVEGWVKCYQCTGKTPPQCGGLGALPHRNL